MHQNAFGGRAPPGPSGGAYSAPPGPLAGLRGKESEGSGKGERAGASKGTPGDAKCVTEIIGGTKIKKLGEQLSLNLVS